MDVRLPDGTVVTNVPEGTTQSELMRRLGKSAPPSQEWMAKTMANMTLADKPWYERAAIQMGAGVDDLVTGVKQLFAGKDEQRELEKEVGQKRVLKKALAQASNTATLPDWMPTGGSALQVAGEVLPTMVVPAGAYAQGARMLPRAVGLMRGAAAPARVGTGALIADAAIGGGVSGALTPTDENESRLMNTVTGAATGGIAPAVMSAARGGYRMMTQGGGQARAGQQIADALTEGAPDQATVLQQTIKNLNSAKQGPIPLSTAAQLRDPQLARLEAGSRARNGANWYDFDQNQARAVASEFNKATSEAEQLAARRGTRKANWDTSWAGAQSAADTAKFAQDLPQFRKNLDVAMVSPEASNPATKAMLQAIADDIDRVTAAGVPYTPAHLQQIRANLSAKWHPANDNAFTKADRSSPARLSVMQEVDDILNATTGGKWQGVVDKYAANSRLVDAAKAAGRAREPFYDETGRVRKVSADAAGDVPKITESALGTAMDRGKGQFSSDAEARLNTILEALRAQNIVQGVKRSATAGGGSNTASDQFAAQTAGKVGDVIAGMAGGPAGAMTKGAIDKALDFANTHRDRALAEALQNPQRLAQILEQRLRSGQPLSATESGVLQILRGVPAAATLN